MSNARNIAGITTDAVNASSELVPVYACRAWVNFNGTGTVAIRDSGNVASITDNGTGDYTINFATAMPDANYVVSGSSGENTTSTFSRYITTMVHNTSYIEIFTTTSAGALDDCASVSVAIFR